MGPPGVTEAHQGSRALTVEVVRSKRRRRTVQAEQVGDTVRISIPAVMSKAEEEHWVAVMVRRFERRIAAAEDDLSARAEGLARDYGLPTPTSIRWVGNQMRRWGSCTPVDGSVRISDRLARYPTWVLDYVIVHELAHLVEPGHGKAFHSLVDRYPKAERARGFLMGVDLSAGEAR
jgi:predicted metal-dependent hydrolase